MIREATYEDIEDVALISEEFFTDNLHDTGLECDHASSYDYVFQLMDQENTVIFVNEDNGIIKGVIAGNVAPWPFNESILVLTEIIWFVPEKYRGNPTIAGRLFLTLKRWGIDMGASVIILHSNVREEAEGVCRFYEKQGVRLTDKTYIGRL